MKTLNKIFTVAGVLATLSLTSCVKDLDLMPNDPNTVVTPNVEQAMAKCYSGIAVSGQTGPNGDSDISGLDGGTSQYTRALFMMNEFTTDESKWIWNDVGVSDLNTNTFQANNANIYGTYSRLYVHIAIVNDFLRHLDEGNIDKGDVDDATIAQFRVEARALRALSYYWACDLWDKVSFIDETSASGDKPKQISRAQLYTWLVTELKDIIANFNDSNIYGRMSKDGVKALLARLYLNAEVYTGTPAYNECYSLCQEIIANHTDGYNGTGLVKDYPYLFAGSNSKYMPGGSGTHEILWGIPYHTTNTQPWGGTTFLCVAGLSGSVVKPADYGLNAEWGCMHATKEFSQKFDFTKDARSCMWTREPKCNIENTEYTTYTDGYQVIKFTNLLEGTGPDNVSDWAATNGSIATANPKFWSADNGGNYGTGAARSQQFPDTDLPLLRLADVYLMAAECTLRGAGDMNQGLAYINVVRSRAGLDALTLAHFDLNELLDERCREMYWELTRRSDLIRCNKYTGSTYTWAWKNNTNPGGSIDDKYKTFPVPTNVLSAQSDFEQSEAWK